MKKIAGLFLLSAFLVACGTNVAEDPTSEIDSLVLPMEVTYKGTPALGNMANVQTVMEWNKRLSEMNTDLGDLLADTVTWHLHDGTEMTAPRDTVVSILKGFVDSMTSMKITYTAVVPVDNTTASDEWVFSWTDETYNYKDGKTEHHFIHEDYRMVDGKIREVFQYARKEAPPAK